MITFLIGLAILVIGGFFYGKFCERTFGPDDRPTPAITKADGVDFVVMKTWKNSLINLLNIAGTGPVLGAIQGILFGPIAFITIPVGCVLAGSMHDYFCGMLSMRNGGAQMPKMIGKYLGSGVHKAYNVVVCILMLLVGAVFIYTPGDLIVTEIIGQKSIAANPTTWIVYGCIFTYYLIATFFPIDAIIGRIYPVFGIMLVLSAVGIFAGILFTGGSDLINLSLASNMFSQHPSNLPFIPVFFITVACGIMSGFHATQTTLISRTMKSEKEGKMTFFNMMLVEGFIAMVWAAGTMVMFSRGQDIKTGATLMVGIISREFLGNIGALFAIIGVVVLPITSGDTALRGLRLMIAEQFHIDQTDWRKRLSLTICIFIPTAIILVFSKLNPNGFNILWRYFAWTNQTIAIFGLAMVSVYLYIGKKNPWISLIPGMFYAFIISSYIFHAPIGFGLEKRLGFDPNSYTISFILGAIFVAFYAWGTLKLASNRKDTILSIDLDKQVKA